MTLPSPIPLSLCVPRYVAGDLHADMEVVLTAVARHKSALQFAAPELQTEPEVLKAAGRSQAVLFIKL